ncbi:MAG: site-specific integrase [Muribaculaceae bacterium]|nr:site-specific integrase [Muribaculaceae bacterium]
MDNNGTLSFLAFARERAEMLYNKGSWRNWRKYCGFINKLEEFKVSINTPDFSFDDITVEFLIKFDDFLHKWENRHEPGKLLHPNTIAIQFVILKALVHRAIEIGVMDPGKNPFLRFKYKGVKTVREKLTESDMKQIHSLQLTPGTTLWHCRNYFLFSYYCAGIRASDLIQLRWLNITENGRLHYQMGKNHKDRDLVLVKQALEILNMYKTNTVLPQHYIFPLLDNNAPYAKFVTQADRDRMKPDLRHKLYIDLSSRNAFINRNLRKIGIMANIKTKLTMHISRHAFAHIAMEAGAEPSAIKDILGHSNLATTERYMGSFDTSRTDFTLMNLFRENSDDTHVINLNSTYSSKEAKAIALLKSMTSKQIMNVIEALFK